MQYVFFCASRRRHTRSKRDWSSDVCSSDLRRRHLYIGFMTSSESAASRPELAPDTIVVETGRPNRADGASVNPAIDLSSTFNSTGDIEPSPFAYARFDTPAWSHFEEALAKLEHAERPGLVFGSGLAAISAVISAVPAGGTLIIPTHSYQGALASAAQIAERQRFELVTVDIADTAAVTAALDAAAEKGSAASAPGSG